VMGNAALAQLELTAQGRHSEPLAQLISARPRAAELCNQLLAYAGRSVPSTELLDCNDEIAELGELLRVTLSKKATLVYELSDEPLCVEADRTQIRQVIMNLITNAAEALGELEGRVVVATSVRVYDEQELEFLRPEAQLPAGEYVVVRVSDDGEGMTPEVQARIFDPFFTTKLTGRGLGLAVVRGIVDGHGGAIELQSEGGVGTSFTVILPRVGIVSPTAELSSEQRSPSAGQRILVVDDERSVREVMGRILVRGGFEVLYAAGGAQAIEIFKAESGRIDGVLLDLSMPQLDGEQTFNALRSIRSDVPVLLCSGYTEREVLARFRGSGLTGALQKPVATELLLRKVGEAVGGGAPMQPSRPWQAARPS